MTLGARVQELMTEQGLSQAELARRVGVTQPAIFALIHHNKTGTRNLNRIARELRTTPAYLEGETADRDSDVPDDLLSAEERRWVEQMRQLSARDRAAVMQLIASLAGQAEPDPPPTLHDKRLAYRAQG